MMDTKTVSMREKDLFHAIESLSNRNGFSPTIRELLKSSNYTSTSMVATALGKLRDTGWINYVDGKSRTITIIGLDKECQLKTPPFFQCCCNCVSLWEDGENKGKKYVCVSTIQCKEGNIAYSGKTSRHSCGCEMWLPNDKYKQNISIEELDKEE